jgi:hypothetical protein
MHKIIHVHVYQYLLNNDYIGTLDIFWGLVRPVVQLQLVGAGKTRVDSPTRW